MVYSSGVDITIDPQPGCSNVARPTTNSCCEAPPCSALVALCNWQRIKGGCDLENLCSFWRRITCQKYTTAYFATSSGQFISWSVRPLFPQLSWVQARASIWFWWLDCLCHGSRFTWGNWGNPKTIPKSSPFSWCKSSPGHGRLRGWKIPSFSSLTICPTNQLNLQF